MTEFAQYLATGSTSRALKKSRVAGGGLAIALGLLATSGAKAHPHVFIDGGIDFIMGAENTLEALEITWRHDAFETLYMLSSFGMELTDEGELSEADRLEIVRQLSDWPADFDGSAHLTLDGAPVALEWPTDLDAHLVEGRLEVTFQRSLETPLDLSRRALEVAFYESTYFFAFSITDTPDFLGPALCDVRVTPFMPDTQDRELQAVLAKLSREETSDIANVGSFFADRIILECA